MPELLLFAASEPRRLASGWLCGTDDPTARYPEPEVRPRAPDAFHAGALCFDPMLASSRMKWGRSASLFPEGPSRLPLRCDDEFAVLWYHPSMQQPVHDEKLLMDDAMSAIRRAIVDEEAGEMRLAPAEPRTSGKKAEAKRTPEAGLLSREATAAIGSAFNTLTETVKKHEPTLEDVVREALRPMLKSWLDENLPRVVEGMVQAEIERVTRGR